jgi:hypothetical protein
MSHAMYAVVREVARYGKTPAAPMTRASLGTSLRVKVSLIVFWYFLATLPVDLRNGDYEFLGINGNSRCPHEYLPAYLAQPPLVDYGPRVQHECLNRERPSCRLSKLYLGAPFRASRPSDWRDCLWSHIAELGYFLLVRARGLRIEAAYSLLVEVMKIMQ